MTGGWVLLGFGVCLGVLAVAVVIVVADLIRDRRR